MPKINSEIGRTSIRESVRLKLWAVSGGRCELCNRLLYQDLVYGVDGNFAEVAHIHAVSEGGPRHKRGMTSGEKNNIDNLMLLCAEHHHMIDTNAEDFKDGLLLQQKKRHEKRILQVTGIPSEQTCRMITYFSNIDNQEIYSSEQLLRQAVMLSGRVPMQEPPVTLDSNSYTRYIPTPESIQQKADDLEREFKIWFDAVVKSKDFIGVFALAPQALLFKLGTLINDQYNAIPYQCHRTGHKWAWPNLQEANTNKVEFIFKNTRSGLGATVALVIDLSATVMDDRIIAALGTDVSIYHLTISEPNRNFVCSENIQEDFIVAFRDAMENLKNLRPALAKLHIFQVMPNSLAIRAGMDYMPKADLPIALYEQAQQAKGFFEALIIGGE